MMDFFEFCGYHYSKEQSLCVGYQTDVSKSNDCTNARTDTSLF